MTYGYQWEMNPGFIDDLRVPVGDEPRLAGLSNGAMADPVLTLVSTESRTVIR